MPSQRSDLTQRVTGFSHRRDRGPDAECPDAIAEIGPDAEGDRIFTPQRSRRVPRCPPQRGEPDAEGDRIFTPQRWGPEAECPDAIAEIGPDAEGDRIFTPQR